MRRRLFIFVLISTVICAVISVWRLITHLFTPYLYERDFLQFYLMGHAIRGGANLYAPLKELAARFEPHLNNWLDISAYPPVVAIVGLPLSFLPYFWAVVVWLIFELGCLVIAIRRLTKFFGPSSLPVLITICIYLSWQPVYRELYLGQFMIPIMLLLTLTWQALKEGKEIKAGLLLGIVFAIKLYAWPLGLFLFIKRRMRCTIVAAVVFLSANAVMTAWTGTATVVDYYTRVGGAVLAQYVSDPFNFSAWSIGFRWAGLPGAVFLLLAVLGFSLVLALRSRDFDTGFMVMLVASTILQPIAWIHYLVTLLPVFCFVVNRPEWVKSDLFLALLLLALILPGNYKTGHTYPAVATWPPFLFTIGLMYLTARNPMRQGASVQGLASEIA
jgi:alpha-1,2-mannosyltransferase